jgi:hypothetical protein
MKTPIFHHAKNITLKNSSKRNQNPSRSYRLQKTSPQEASKPRTKRRDAAFFPKSNKKSSQGVLPEQKQIKAPLKIKF